MERFTISRDDRYHEAWPSTCRTAEGELICAYAEADVHGGGAVPSAVVRKSRDDGRTWSEPIIIDTLYDSAEQGYIMCRAIVCLDDGTLLVAADWAPEYTRPPGMPHNWKYDPMNEQGCEAWLYRSIDHGQTWTGPERSGCLTISLTMKVISDGTLFLCGVHYRCEGLYEAQMIYRSTDGGRSWGPAITVVDDPRWNCDEGDILEMPGGELIMYMRGGPKQGNTICGLKAISRDGGDTWDGPYAAGKWPISGRVAAGLLSSGEVLVMHRVGGFALQHMYGFFLESAETALRPIEYADPVRFDPPAGAHWGIIDNDTAPHADNAYGDWLELADGDVYAVNYIVDDAPENCPQIRGYRIKPDELARPPRDVVIDFEPPRFLRGKLGSQHSWVRQRPDLWYTRGLASGSLGALGNYVIVDTSGDHSFSGRASITGSRNKGCGEEVLRRDIGPYDLALEKVVITLIHSGRQYYGMFRVLEASGQTLVQLHCDYEYETLWAHDNLGRRAVSQVGLEDGWWETRLDFGGETGAVKISTRAAGTEGFGAAWGTINLMPGAAYDIVDEVNPDLVGSAQHTGVIAAIAVAMGDRGALYIDRVEVEARPR